MPRVPRFFLDGYSFDQAAELLTLDAGQAQQAYTTGHLAYEDALQQFVQIVVAQDRLPARPTRSATSPRHLLTKALGGRMENAGFFGSGEAPDGEARSRDAMGLLRDSHWRSVMESVGRSPRTRIYLDDFVRREAWLVATAVGEWPPQSHYVPPTDSLRLPATVRASLARSVAEVAGQFGSGRTDMLRDPGSFVDVVTTTHYRIHVEYSTFDGLYHYLPAPTRSSVRPPSVPAPAALAEVEDVVLPNVARRLVVKAAKKKIGRDGLFGEILDFAESDDGRKLQRAMHELQAGMDGADEDEAEQALADLKALLAPGTGRVVLKFARIGARALTGLGGAADLIPTRAPRLRWWWDVRSLLPYRGTTRERYRRAIQRLLETPPIRR